MTARLAAQAVRKLFVFIVSCRHYPEAKNKQKRTAKKSNSPHDKSSRLHRRKKDCRKRDCRSRTSRPAFVRP